MALSISVETSVYCSEFDDGWEILIACSNSVDSTSTQSNSESANNITS